MEESNEKFKAFIIYGKDGDTIVVRCIISENEELLNKEISKHKHSVKSLEELESILSPEEKVIIIGIDELYKGYYDEKLGKKEGEDILISMLNSLSSKVNNISINYDNRVDLNSGIQLLKEAFDRINFPDKIYVYTGQEYSEIPPSLSLIREIDDIVELTVKDIEDKDFSPLEKLISATAIAEKLVVNDKDLVVNVASDAGGNIYEALSGNSILCQGYSNILELFANKLGIKAERKNFYSYGYNQLHEVSIADLEDPKYDIKGKYLFDITPLGSTYSWCVNYNNERAKNFILYLKHMWGVGKDKFNEYEEYYGNQYVLDEEFEQIKSLVSNESIPFEKVKEAVQVVRDSYIFEAGTLSPEQVAESFLKDKDMPEETKKAETVEKNEELKNPDEKGEI